MKTRFDNVTVIPDRHGKLRAVYRKHGKATYLKTLPDQPGFEAELAAAVKDRVIAVKAPTPRSVNDLVVRYYRSADFAAKGGDDDKLRRRRLIESFRAQFGNDMVADFSFEHIEAILIGRSKKQLDARGRLVGGEVAATNLRKQLTRLFAYAKKLKWITANPVDDADKVGKLRLEGYHTWTEDEITQYKQRHPRGTKARLALEIILWTGMRRGDARLFGPRHIARGKINFRASKNQRDMWLPIAPDLKAAIAAMPSVGITSYLVSELGKPFSKGGFGLKMREWCNEAGLPQCSSHGLRKAIARRGASSRATQGELKAIGGWKKDDEVTIYTEAVEQEDMADAGMARVIGMFSGKDDSSNA